MEEIKAYLDKKQKNEVGESIKFEIVEAGKVSQRSIFIKNVSRFNLTVEISLKGEAIKISKTIENLIPREMKELVFELMPKMTMIKPINATLKVKLNYVVE